MKTGTVGEVPVEDQDVISRRAELDVGFARAQGDVDSMAIATQTAGDHIGEIGLVFDYE
jgi:hypothetical protein